MIKFDRKLERYSISPIAAGFLVLVVTFLLYQLIGGALTLLFVGVKVTAENAGTVRLLTSISQIIFLLLTTIIFAKIIYNDFETVFKISKPIVQEVLVSTLGLFFLITASQSYLYLQSNVIEYLSTHNESFKSFFSALDKFNEIIEESYLKIISSQNIFDFVSIVLSVALVPAFCEEFLFRGFVQTSFEQKLKPFWAITLTGILFGIFHFNPYAIIPLVALGIYFSYLAFVTESIFVPIILHFVNNFFTVSIFYFTKSEDLVKTQVSSEIPDQTLIISLITAVFLFIASIVILNKMINYRRFKNTENRNEYLP